MSEKRMAGEKLNEPTKESADAKEALSTSARRKQIREEIGNDPERLAQRISGVDREKYDFDGYSDKQINMALQGKTFGDEDYARLTGKSVGEDTPKEETPENEGSGGNGGETGGGVGDVPKETENVFMPSIRGPRGGQTIFQDNDQTSTVTGDNNTVTNNQDNSINGYSYSGKSSFKDAWMKDYFS